MKNSSPKVWPPKKTNKNAPQFLRHFSGYKRPKRLGHDSVWSTKTFLYDIREARYKNIKMGYQITKVLYIGQSSSLKFDVQFCLTYFLAALRFTEIVLSF